MQDQQQILLQTKLHRPRVPRDLVVRPRLLERLNHGLNSRLTVISGAAGYGKSTLVSSWIESMAGGQESTALPVMWLSLDENDDVNRREDAVAQAAALGLIALPEPWLI